MTRTRQSIPSYMSDPLTQITDLEDAIRQCSIETPEGHVMIRVCSYDHGLIRNEDNKPIYLTEFQKGAMYILVTDNKNPFKVMYLCKPREYHESHGLCKTCLPRVYQELERYQKSLQERVDETFTYGERPVM